MKDTSQHDAILETLKLGRALTPLDALRDFGCFRLGARIYDLKREGYRINRKMVSVGDSIVAEYRMEA